jgi:NAD(P)H dehydrogenase (quinone)
MKKPRILVLTAAGRTGMPVALQLLEEGFPVTAFVHRADQRSARLKAKGADIVVGSLTDINDMRTAMAGAQRAYFCVPNEAGTLKAAEILARPEGHAGKTYRPTGPKLLSPQEIAAILGKVLERKVRYINAPMKMVAKVMRGRLSLYNLAVVEQYMIDYQKNAFGVGAPTDVVRRITGREAEEDETIARRYVATTPGARRSFAIQFRLMLGLLISLLRPAPKTAPYLALDEFSERSHVVFSADSPEWRQSHEPQGSSPSGEKTAFQHATS